MQLNDREIILVEDDPIFGQLCEATLIQEGALVTWVKSGKHFLNIIESKHFDFAILDVILPDINGIELCQQFRKQVTTPVIMLTSMESEAAEINALEAGADQYLHKPMAPSVVSAHVNAILRRTENPKNSPSIQVKDLFIDACKQTVTQEGNTIVLTEGEFNLLVELAKNIGQTLNREQLFKTLRNISYDGFDRAIDVRIASLRKQLGDKHKPHKYIKTVRNAGYAFIADTD